MAESELRLDNFTIIYDGAPNFTGWLQTIPPEPDSGGSTKYWYYIEMNIAKTGWISLSTGNYYLSEESNTLGRMLTGIQDIEGSRYWLLDSGSPEGARQDNKFYPRNPDGNTNVSYMYFGSNGKAVTGWNEISGKNYYFIQNATVNQYHMVTGKQYLIPKRQSGYHKYFYFNNKGEQITNEGLVAIDETHLCYVEPDEYHTLATDTWKVVTVNNKKYRYYFNSSAVCICETWIKIGTKWYWFNKDTGMQTNTWITNAGKTYYVNNYGECVYGWYKIDGEYYYFSETTGALVTNGTHTIGDREYTFDETGHVKLAPYTDNVVLTEDAFKSLLTNVVLQNSTINDSNKVTETHYYCSKENNNQLIPIELDILDSNAFSGDADDDTPYITTIKINNNNRYFPVTLNSDQLINDLKLNNYIKNHAGDDGSTGHEQVIGTRLMMTSTIGTEDRIPTLTNTAFSCSGGGYFGGYFKASKVFNAVFNDYAEYRATTSVRPGQCVVDNDDGSMRVTDKRLIPGASVVSDTFGTAMGMTDKCKTPLAVAGRVLVYPARDRSEYHAGMAVCASADGKVDIMTREEIRDYPDCIVGIVSEIPEYETWGSDNVKVDGRIWIKVR